MAANVKDNFITGAGAVLASDFVGPRLPAALDVACLPVRKWGAAVAGAWVAEKAQGRSPEAMRAALLGLAAMAGAELKSRFLPGVAFGLAGVDLTRLAAGGAGVYLGEAAGVL